MHAKRVVATTLSVAILLAAASASAAFSAYMQMTGTKQGQLKGRSQKAENLPLVSFDYSVISPRDVATGQASGKRQHKPITIVREIDSASPLLYQALVTNEALKSCVLVEPEAGVAGGTVTVTLANAQITAQTALVADAKHPELDKTRKYETLSINFDRMDIVHNPSGKTESFTY
jgi:type VI secretion system secreted protein Hcp